MQKLLNRGWWMTMMMFMPRPAMSTRLPRMSAELVASRPLVGSSRNSRLGMATSSSPMLTRLRWPPLMPRFSTVPTCVCVCASVRFCMFGVFAEMQGECNRVVWNCYSSPLPSPARLPDQLMMHHSHHAAPARLPAGHTGARTL